jgi:dihydroorotate dehydrogenase (NAD+) catalytic subunit
LTHSLHEARADVLSGAIDPTWDVTKSYSWNLANGPSFSAEIPSWPIVNKPRNLLGFALRSPVGVAAGPLLSSKWIKLYAELGFGILTYKTVRTRAWPSYRVPNIAFIEPGDLFEPNSLPQRVRAGVMPADASEITITNSFGMPSASPAWWREDVGRAKSYIGEGQLLVVSVVGTVEQGAGLGELVRDYVRCAVWAAEAGADIVEANLSCPSVSSVEAELYLKPDAALAIVESIKQAIGSTPLSVKLGYFRHAELMFQVMTQIGSLIDLVTSINAVKVEVVDTLGNPVLPGRALSGICGARIRKLGLQSVTQLGLVRRELGLDFRIIGCGGITMSSHVREYLDAGADVVEIATAAIWNPYLALQVAMSHEL